MNQSKRASARRPIPIGTILDVDVAHSIRLFDGSYAERGCRLIVWGVDRDGDPIAKTLDGLGVVLPIFADELLRCTTIVTEGSVDHRDGSFDLVRFFDDKAAWSLDTFGPGDRYNGVVEHIRRELQEILLKPTDLVEWVDVVLLAMDGAWRSADANGERFVATLIEKDRKNRTRSWPDWRTLKPDEVSEHHRADDMWNRPSLKRLRFAMRHAVSMYRMSKHPDISVGVMMDCIDGARRKLAFAIVIMQIVVDEGSVPEKSVARYQRALGKLTKKIGTNLGDAL